MATVKCALGKRGRPSHEWNDGKKDRIYCLGRVDPMTDAPLPECLACPDFVDKAQDDLETFYGRTDEFISREATIKRIKEVYCVERHISSGEKKRIRHKTMEAQNADNYD